MRSISLFVLASMPLSFLLVGCTQPVGWRGDGSGRYPDARPTLHWAKERNVIWKTPMPAASNATPVICGQRIFVTAEPATLICVNKADGKILWKRSNTLEESLQPDQLAMMKRALKAKADLEAIEAKLNALRTKIDKLTKEDTQNQSELAGLKDEQARLETQQEKIQTELDPIVKYTRPHVEDIIGYSTPTPVTDGKCVWAVFGVGIVACYDVDGNLKWRKWMQMVEDRGSEYGQAPSPLLAGGKLILQTHLWNTVALNPQTGAEHWRIKSRVRFGTPALATVGGATIAITPEGDFIRVSDGQKLAAVPARLDYNCPIVRDGVVYFFGETNDHRPLAVKLPEKAEKFTPEVIWKTRLEKDHTYFSSPAWHKELAYAVTADNRLTVFHTASGNVAYRRKLDTIGGRSYPSVTIAGDNVFVSGDEGITVIFAHGPQYQELAVNTLEPFRSSLVFEGDRMYVRTLQNLYCIGPQ